MLSLLRSDVYQTLRARWFRGVLIFLASMALIFGLIYRFMPGNDTEYIEADTQALYTSQSFQGLTTSDANILLGAGLMTCVVGMVAAQVVCSELDSGWARTVLSARRGRLAWAGEKCLFVALLSAFYLLVGFGFDVVGQLIAGYPVLNPESVAQIVGWLACLWLVTTAWAEIIVLVCCVFRSKSLGIALALFLTSGLAGALAIQAIAAVAAVVSPADPTGLLTMAQWLPVTALETTKQGAAAVLSTADVTGVMPLVRAAVTCVPLGLLVSGASAFVSSRKDV